MHIACWEKTLILVSPPCLTASCASEGNVWGDSPDHLPSGNSWGGRGCHHSPSIFLPPNPSIKEMGISHHLMQVEQAAVHPDQPLTVCDAMTHVKPSGFAPPVVSCPLFLFTCPHRHCSQASAGSKIVISRWQGVGWGCFVFEIRVASFLCSRFHMYPAQPHEKGLKSGRQKRRETASAPEKL